MLCELSAFVCSECEEVAGWWKVCLFDGMGFENVLVGFFREARAHGWDLFRGGFGFDLEA